MIGQTGHRQTVVRSGLDAVTAVAVVSDHPAAVAAIEGRLRPFREVVRVVDAEAGADTVGTVDVVVFDTFGSRRAAIDRLQRLRGHIGVTPIVVLSADMPRQFVEALERIPLVVLVPKAISSAVLAEFVREVGSGMRVDRVPCGPHESAPRGALDEEEREVLSLVVEGCVDAEIAHELMRPVGRVTATVDRGLQRLGVAERARLSESPVASQLRAAAAAVRGLDLRCDTEDVAMARRFVGERLHDAGADHTSVSVFRLAVSELGSNVVEHGTGERWSVCAYGSDEWWSVEVEGIVGDHAGPLLRPGDWHLAEPRASSGRGLGIVRHLMDEVTVLLTEDRARVVCRRRR